MHVKYGVGVYIALIAAYVCIMMCVVLCCVVLLCGCVGWQEGRAWLCRRISESTSQ